MNIIEKNNNNCIKTVFTKDSSSELIFFKNFLPEHVFHELKQNILLILKNSKTDITHLPKIYYGHSNTGNHPIFVPFWSCVFTHNEFFNKTIMDYLEKYTNKKFKIKRIYASFQTLRQIGNWHIDDSESNTYTFTLYVDINKKDMDIKLGAYNHINLAINHGSTQSGGEFRIKMPNESHMRFFECNSNYGVFFSSTLHHCGNCYDNFVDNCIRCVIAYKLYII